MLRAIVRFKLRHENGAQWERLSTTDFDAPELEEMLSGGGMDQDSYSVAEVVGVEVLEGRD